MLRPPCSISIALSLQESQPALTSHERYGRLNHCRVSAETGEVIDAGVCPPGVTIIAAGILPVKL